MSNFLKALLFFGIALTSQALFAENPQLVAPPKPPLLINAPNNSEWSIIWLNNTSQAGASAESNASRAVRYVNEIHVTKNADTRREIILWSDGAKSERWFYKGMLLSEQPGNSDIYIQSPEQLAGTPGFSGYTKMDFPELAWISGDAYQDVVKLENRTCYHYKGQNIADEASSNPRNPSVEVLSKSTLEAWIDAGTKLPAVFNNEKYRMVYSFKLTKPERLTLPERFEKALKSYQKSLDMPSVHQMSY